MKLRDLIDVSELNELIQNKYVTSRSHPTLPLNILNYTPAAIEIKSWSDTLSLCRGLVYDNITLDVVAIPFRKFWNYQDEGHPETLDKNLPTGIPYIYEKVDGSLGIGFFYRGKFIVATRGSFESDQAKWANYWVKKNIDFSLSTVDDYAFTYLFEIVYPQDKKVVNYSESGLVLLGIIDNDTAEEGSPEEHEFFPFLKNCRDAKKIEYESLESLQKKDIANEEGYVAVWYTWGFAKRVKIKFDTYKFLHRLRFQTTPEVIWQLTKDGVDISLHLMNTDQNLIEWATEISQDINKNYATLSESTGQIFREAVGYVNSQFDLESSEKDRRKWVK